ncbi:Photosystem ii protein [Thalictrum thalictroides]|uniref:Photosystem ii protein n=1 Tax=Thalictrum thalictroides TaxID=46969 RepID=A0A7J6VRF5_THATH|nr:Photosystem ii protein [Thalictrum thalictroides]
MASITISTPSFVGSLTASERALTTSGRRTLVVAKAASSTEGVVVKQVDNSKKENNNGRRDLMFAAAAAAACSIAGVALADEPPRGSAEAKSKYAPICVTMPTARICHK